MAWGGRPLTMHRGIFLLCGCHSLSGERERESRGGGGRTSLPWSLLNYGGGDYWWERGCGLRQPSEEPFVFQPGRGQVFVTILFYLARIGLLCGVRRMAEEGFTAVGVTEEGAERGWGMASVCKCSLPPLKCWRKGWINGAGPTLCSASQERFRLKLSSWVGTCSAGINSVTLELVLLTHELTPFSV